MESTKVNSRYSLVKDKNRNEEVVLLQGLGCFWKKCVFCDYYEDSAEIGPAVELNEKVLSQVTGETGWLTVINSGSFFELPQKTKELIESILRDKSISDLTIEAHLKYKPQVDELREKLKKKGIRLHCRIGIETFDTNFREEVLNKGFGNLDLDNMKQTFDECCLLYGIKGQKPETLLQDVKTALDNFNDVYLNIYENRTGLQADESLIQDFVDNYYMELNKIENLHILINNTDLGVG